MNKIYKVIWSKTKNCYVAVSEMAKSHGRDKSKTSRISSVKGSLSVGLAALIIASLGALTPLNVNALEEIHPMDNLKNIYFHINDENNGEGNKETNAGSIAENAGATGKNSITAGKGAQATAENAMAVGNNAHAYGKDSVAVGEAAQALADDTVAAGQGAEARGKIGRAHV